jgi:cytochrome c biogenesis protein CcmG, thiol:disulfide interchange protein DsbE
VELPRLEPLFQSYNAKGLRIVAVERSRDTERAKKFIADNKLTYRFLENGEGDAEVVRRVFGVTTFPTSFLIDREGRVMRVHVGFEAGDEKELEAQIRELLGLPPLAA